MENKVKRRKKSALPNVNIWESCDASISIAIEEFSEQSAPYSTFSRRYPILRLIKEVIDPAVVAYMKTLPDDYMGFVPGAGREMGYSEVTRLLGFDSMVRVQRQLLRHFLKTRDKHTSRDKCFIATLESLADLIFCCMYKQPKISTAAADINLNTQRRQGFCEFCGNLTELSSFIKALMTGQPNNIEPTEEKKFELSHKYCTEHRSQLMSGEWNPAYKQAKRSLTQFNIELRRLSLQCTLRAIPNAQSGDQLVDAYFFQYMLSQTLSPSDKAELRNLARLMVDSKLSDNKKKMLVLQKFGFSQYEIGQKLLNRKQQPMTRQAVSKALAAIRKPFLLPN